MPINNTTTLAYPPLQVPMVDKSGRLTTQWSMWFQQAYLRMGGQAPVNPQIKTQLFASGYPFSFSINPGPGQVTFNGRAFNMNDIIVFYQSGLSVTSLIDSFTVQNASAVQGILNAWIVPFNSIPASSNQLVLNQKVPALSTPIGIQQFTGQEIGSGAYAVVTCNPSNGMLCTMKGRLLT